MEKEWHWVHGHIHEITVSRTSVPLALLHRRTRLWMEAGWKTFAAELQHCSEAECLCIDLAERENREIFHMFISRTPRDKQPSPSLSLLPLKAQPAQVIKILPSQGEITLCRVAKAQSWKDSSALFVLLSVPPFLPVFIYQILYKMYLSSSPLHHLPSDRPKKNRLRLHTLNPISSRCAAECRSDQLDFI